MFNPYSVDAIGPSVDQYTNGKVATMGQEINDHWTVSIPENVLFQQIGDRESEIVLLDVQSGGYFGLNEVGAGIWSLMREGETIGSIFASLLQEYEVDEERLRGDLVQFLTELHSRGLIEIHENSAR
jgi:hypothetical protein